MKMIWKYLKAYKKECVISPLFKMLEALFELFVPLVIARIIDVGIDRGDNSFILNQCLILVGLAILGLICSIIAQYYAAKAAIGCSTKMRYHLFKHIQELSFSEIDTVGSSTLIARMTSDINQVQNGINLVLRLFLRSPFIVFGAMIMAFTIDWKAAMIFVITIPILTAVVFGIMLSTNPLYKKVQANLDKVLGITRENLTGVRVIRAFNKEESEVEHFKEENELLNKTQKFVGKISGLMNPLTYLIVNVAIIALIWTGGIRVNVGTLSQGEVVALYNYMTQILVELIKLANLVISISKALACANRIDNIFELEQSLVDGNIIDESSMDEYSEQINSKQENAVEFKNVTFAYAGAGDASLENINFSAKKGQTIGVIGGTGSGKSTLVNLIPRFYDTLEGEVLVNGVNVKEYGMNYLRNKVGIVMQKALLFHGTVSENIRWGKTDATKEEILEALDISQAREFVEKKDGKLEAEIEQRGKNLSGGQQQRMSIARAIVRKPDILILDDSSSALDFATDAALRGAIAKIKGMTVFIVSQRASSIMYADQIIVLDDGKMVGIGKHEELLKNCPVYQEIYYSQIQKKEA